MHSSHKILFKSAAKMQDLAAGSINLIVTSPPYPMIEMWDDLFCAQNPAIRHALENNNGMQAFEEMHRTLDYIWIEAGRVLKEGGIICVNIGDATRSIGGDFQLYPNHVRILQALMAAGLQPLPDILWRKQTNAPNKFMGSGMLPAGAYATLEHEYILIARKGAKRVFRTQSERDLRRESAFFWEERNVWFSDVWTDVKGTGQALGNARARSRSAAFPFEIPYRLITMYSVKQDMVLDPFLGTGTTMVAAMAAGRNSIGFEMDEGLKPVIEDAVRKGVSCAHDRIERRLRDHQAFVSQREREHGPLKHYNQYYNFPVMTTQEIDLRFDLPERISCAEDGGFEVTYT